MQIAVVGAGLAGLAVSYFLLKKGCQVTLFDENGVGAGASKIEIGLCHPYIGRSGKPSKHAEEAMKLTLELIQEAEKMTGEVLVDLQGILRVDWKPHEMYSDLEEKDSNILIRSGLTVFLRRYVKALYRSMPGINFIRKKITDEAELKEFNYVIFSAGYGTKEVFKDLEFNYVKGQVVFVESERGPNLTLMKAHGHMSPIGENLYQIGSTYEHDFFDDKPDLERAVSCMKQKIDAFMPDLKNANFKKSEAGVRVTNQEGYLPIVKKVSEKSFVFSGLGSRGLLYHAYYGRLLADMVT